MVSLEKAVKVLLLSYSILVGRALSNKATTENAQEDSTGEKIVGGVAAEKFRFPYIVHLTLSNADSASFCGGSIINESWVLTAGHCVSGMTSALIVAGVLRRSDKNEEGRQERTSSHLIQHENYREVTSKQPPENDVALIKLSRPLEMTDAVKSIPLADWSIDDTRGTVVVAGWGTLAWGSSPTEELRTADLSIVNRETCQQKYDSSSIRPPLRIQINEMCASSPGKGACSGDSGGPLVCTYENIEYVCGIVSWGIRCNRNFPGVYSRVKYHHEWIVKSGAPSVKSVSAIIITGVAICSTFFMEKVTKLIGIYAILLK